MIMAKEQNLVGSTALTTSKAADLISCPSWLTRFSGPKLLSVFSLPLQQRLLLFLFIVFGLGQTEAGFFIHRTAQREISSSAPVINVGILIDASEDNTFEADDDCTDDVGDNLIYPMAAEYMRESLHNSYNVSVGFYAIDTCGSRTAAMHQALAFLPNSVVVCNSKQSYSNLLRSIPVYGVVSTLRPTRTTPAFAALNAVGLPSISMYGSEKLNRKKYPNLYYFLPNEDVEVNIIPLLLKDNNWHLVSVVHEDRIAFSNVFLDLEFEMEQVCEVNASECLCIATVQTLTLDASTSEADAVVNELVEHKGLGANVVVVIASYRVVLKLFEAVDRHSPHVQFLWIATQSWAWRFNDLMNSMMCDHMSNTLFIFPWWSLEIHIQTRKFLKDLYYFLSPRLTGSWYRPTLQRYLCKGLNQEQCTDALRKWHFGTNQVLVSTFFATYEALCFAVFQSVNRCTGDSSQTRCIREHTGRTLMNDEKISKPKGKTHIFEHWVVFNWRLRGREDLGNYSAIDNKYNRTKKERITLLSPVKGSVNVLNCSVEEKWIVEGWEEKVPVFSGCRPVCNPQERLVPQKPKECCWRCVACRYYEVVTENRTRCEICPETKWPDQATNFTTCYSLPVFIPKFSHYWPKVLVAMAVCLITLELLVVAFFLWKRKERVIKATSLQLSMLMQLGMILGSAGIIVACAPASPLTCPLSDVLHELSSSLLLCPLFIRTLLIFRIFRLRHRVTVSLANWVCMCLLLAVVKPILSLMEWSSPKASQPINYRKYVELHCTEISTLASVLEDIHKDSIMSYTAHWLKTAYTATLTVLCLGLAYQLRHLPDNFNESGFIFMCIMAEITSTSLISSAASVMKRRLQKMYFETLGYALNLLLYLIFLFFTKIYAVLFVTTGKCQVQETSRSRTTETCKDSNTRGRLQLSAAACSAGGKSAWYKITEESNCALALETCDDQVIADTGLFYKESSADMANEANLDNGVASGSSESKFHVFGIRNIDSRESTVGKDVKSLPRVLMGSKLRGDLPTKAGPENVPGKEVKILPRRRFVRKFHVFGKRNLGNSESTIGKDVKSLPRVLMSSKRDKLPGDLPTQDGPENFLLVPPRSVHYSKSVEATDESAGLSPTQTTDKAVADRSAPRLSVQYTISTLGLSVENLHLALMHSMGRNTDTTPDSELD